MSTVTLLILLLTMGTVTCQYHNYPYSYQYYQYPQQQQPRYSNPRPYVVHNVINDPIWGGPTSLGWAQAPRHLSPMFSPVYGGR